MSLMTCIPYKYWARSHNHHHAHQGQLDTRTIERCYFVDGERIQRTF